MLCTESADNTIMCSSGYGNVHETLWSGFKCPVLSAQMVLHSRSFVLSGFPLCQPM